MSSMKVRTWCSSKMLCGMPKSHIGVLGFQSQLHFEFQFPAKERVVSQKVMDQVVVYLPPFGDLDRVPSSLLWHVPVLTIDGIWGVNQWIGDLFLSLSFFLPSFLFLFFSLSAF